MDQKTKCFGLGIFICIFNEDFSKILLLKRNQEKRNLRNGDWGNVGGRVEWGEKLIEACVRESKEEISVSLLKNKIKLIEIKEITKNSIFPHVHFLQFVYTATISESSKIILNNESEEYKWFDINNLPERMIDHKEDILKWLESAKNSNFSLS